MCGNGLGKPSILTSMKAGLPLASAAFSAGASVCGLSALPIIHAETVDEFREIGIVKIGRDQPAAEHLALNPRRTLP